MTIPTTSRTVVTGAIPMMALACGITVANVYLCQPLLASMSTSMNASIDITGWVATAAQVGYALGILLIVPLADRASTKKLIRTLLSCAGLALVAAGCAPNIYFLIAATFAVTLVTVIPQVLIPIAISTAAQDRSGRVVGVMQSGLIVGILLSRTISGMVGEYSGSWRTSYFLAAVLTLGLLLLLPRFIPERPISAQTSQLSYLSLLRSLPSLLVRWSGLRLSVMLGAAIFGAFSAFWATLAFHLARPPFEFGSAQAGLFGLWGAAGALIAPFCGKLSDKYGPSILNLLAIVSTLLAFVSFIAGGDVYVAAIVVGVNLLDFGNQAGQIANQARIFKLDPGARARLNTIYMVATFGGGALGSTLGTISWSIAGWRGVCIAGIGLSLCAAVMLTGWCLLRKAKDVPSGNNTR